MLCFLEILAMAQKFIKCDIFYTIRYFENLNFLEIFAVTTVSQKFLISGQYLFF